LHLPEVRAEVLGTVLDAMPPFPERANMLEARLKKATEDKADLDVWGKGTKEGEGEESARSRGASLEAGAVGVGAGAAAGAATAAAGGGEDDLLGMSSAPAPAPAAAAVDPASVPVTTRVGIDAALAARVEAWLRAAMVKPAAVVFEDAYVQIGVKATYSGAEGRLSLFIGNKTAAPLSLFKLRVLGTAALKATTGDVAASIAPKAQSQVAVTLEAMQPFAEPLALQVSFISTPGTGHVYPLSLPASLHSFCEGAAMPADEFKAKWTALAGAPREVTAVITPAAAAVSRAAADAALALARFEPVAAGAPGATGASSFRTKSVSAAGAPISVGCLCMAIPDEAAGVYKVAVRTQHPDVSKALMAVLQQALSA